MGGYFLLFISRINVAKEMSSIKSWKSSPYVTAFIRTTPFPKRLGGKEVTPCRLGEKTAYHI